MTPGNYLITTDGWFVAPDGRQYQAVYGHCEVFSDEEILGVKTNEKSTNWYVRVGDEENNVVIAGCQIHYACKCSEPNRGDSPTWAEKDGEVKKYQTPSRIYFVADDPKRRLLESAWLVGNFAGRLEGLKKGLSTDEWSLMDSNA